MTDDAPPRIDQQVTFIYAEDLEATLPFYREVLGLEEVLDQGQCKIFRAGPAGFIGVCRVRPGRHSEPRGVVFTFVTDEVDAWHRRLEARGVEGLQSPRYSEQFQVYNLFVRDPNGYLLEFQQFRDSRWPRA